MKKVLIANRGEIACRVIRSCQALGIKTVGVYSEADQGALHTMMADEAYLIGPARARESYLDVAALINAVKRSGAQGVHPGYGFLAENADFARAVIDEGCTWIGPHPDTITAMGDKENARRLAVAARVPVLPGSRRFTAADAHRIASAADDVGYPLLVKAAGGGGGIGMQYVADPASLARAVESTQALALRAFGDDTVYLERLVRRARHVEVQVFGFGDGRVVHLFERECSVQRRFQKIIEESPAPLLDAATLAAMTSAAVALAALQKYEGAGTVEFILDVESGEFFFLEMNTRIQVEHPVTEMTTGLDLVGLQLRQAAGENLSGLAQASVDRKGHAIECRLYAENPSRKFFPAPGRLDVWEYPEPDAAFRIETGVRPGDAISTHYDPMIAKIVCSGRDREDAIANCLRQLHRVRVGGIATNLQFLSRVLRHPSFASGRFDTRFIEDHQAELLAG